MKIGIVTQYYPPNILGGSHISIFNIAKGLSINGHQVEIFTSEIMMNKHEEKKYQLKNVKINRLFSKEYSNGILQTLSKQKEMITKLRLFLAKEKKQFDILYSYGMDTIPAVVECKQFSKKTAASVNGSWVSSPYYHVNYKGEETLNCSGCYFWKDTFMRIFHKNPPGSGGNKWMKILLSPAIRISFKKRQKYIKQIDVILPVSHKLKEIVANCGVPKNKIFVCHALFENQEKVDWDIYKQLNIPRNKKIMLYAGRFLSIKGCKEILESIPGVIAKHKDAHFVFLGAGKEGEEAFNKVIKLGLEKHVTFTKDFVNSQILSQAFKQSFLSLYPVLCFDALPRTPTESFIEGTPVIATTMGGLQELILDKQTGLIVRPGNYSDISKAINLAIKDKKLYDKMSKGAIEFSKKMFIEKGIKKYISTFEWALKN
jgi:glycosyltransferase involved in cell wall biosynthesis